MKFFEEKSKALIRRIGVYTGMLGFTVTLFALFAIPARAIVLCYDYVLYRVACAEGRCKDANNTTLDGFRKNLGALGYKSMPMVDAVHSPETADVLLKPGDVLILGNSHAGYVNASGKIDHFIQVPPDRSKGEEWGKQHDPLNLPKNFEGQKGGFFEDNTVRDFVKVVKGTQITFVELWRKGGKLAGLAGEWDVTVKYGDAFDQFRWTITRSGFSSSEMWNLKRTLVKTTNPAKQAWVGKMIEGSWIEYKMETTAYEYQSNARPIQEWASCKFTETSLLCNGTHVDDSHAVRSVRNESVIQGTRVGANPAGEPPKTTASGTPAQPTRANVEILEITGDAELFPGDLKGAYKLNAGVKISIGDRIETGMDTKVKLQMPDGSIVEIKELSDIRVEDIKMAPESTRTRLWLKAGEVEAEVPRKKPSQSDFGIRVGKWGGGVRGTRFSVKHDPGLEKTTFAVREGTVEIRPEDGSQAGFLLNAGQAVDITGDRVGQIRTLDGDRTASISKLPGRTTSVNGGQTTTGTWGPINQRAGLAGTTMTFYRATTVASCQADCDRNRNCQAFTFVRAGGYSPADPPLCYLMASTSGFTPSDCCISAIKNGDPVAAKNLSGTWSCSDGGTYVISQTGNKVVWRGMSGDGGRSWTHTFEGTIEGDRIVGYFRDGPPGASRGQGPLTVKINGTDRLEKLSGPNFGGDVWKRGVITN